MAEQFTLADYDDAADAIRKRSRHSPRIGLILGSGLGVLADAAENADVIDYQDLPNFPVSTVPGHAGRLVVGTLAGANVAIMQGRFHFYEGWTPQQVVFPVRVMRRLGIETLILTNAAGGLNPTFAVGDIMLIEDHINFVGMAGANPLRGANVEEFGVRFPAANRIYTRSLRNLARTVAHEEGIDLRSGVYAALSGPNFESPAEIRMWRILGADAVV
jgi:purine-nucleoside phosphorylase